MDRPEVAILMASYNGEAYIAQQLESLINQTYPYWRLIIHDDGSTDRTLSIVKSYQKRDSRIVIMDDGVVNLGAAQNYLHLLAHVEADFYMFCDQDDIWLEAKVERMMEAITALKGPAAAYVNAYFYKDGKIIKQLATTIHPTTVKNTLFLNAGIQGCSMIVNRQLVDLLKPFPDKVAMHDHLLTIGAIVFGKFVYLNEVLTLYRQHDLNASGNQHVGIWQRISSFLALDKPVIDRKHFEANCSFYKRFSKEIGNDIKKLFVSYFKYAEKKSIFGRISIVLCNGFSLGNRKGILLLKTLIRKPIA